MQLWRQGCQPHSLGGAELRGGRLQQTLLRRQVCVVSLGAFLYQLHQLRGCFQPICGTQTLAACGHCIAPVFVFLQGC